MDLNYEVLKRIYNQIVSGNLSREDAESWVREWMELIERDEISYTPDRDRERLFASTLYLRGVANKDAPDSYLLALTDIEEKFQSVWSDGD